VDLRTQRFTFVSPSITRLRGLTVEEALAEPIEASMTPDSFARIQGELAELVAGRRGDRNIGIIDQPCKDGSVKHVEITSTIVRDGSGVPVEVVGVSRDVTGRVDAEDRLARSEALLRGIAESSPDPIFAKDLAGAWTFANAAVLRVLGRTSDQVIGRTDLEIHADRAVAEQVMANDRRVLRSETPLTVAETLPTPAGIRKFQSTKAPLRDAEGRVVGVVGIARDVTGSERAAEELRRSRQRLALAMRGSTDGFFDIELGPRRAFLSARYRQIVGCPSMPDEVGLQELMAIVDPAHLPTIEAGTEALRNGSSEQFTWDYKVRGEDRAVRWVRARGRVVERTADGTPSRISGTISDIHERKEAEEALRASEGRLRTIARSFPSGSVALFDADDRLVFVDGSALFVLPERGAAIGKRPREFAPPELAAQILLSLRRARAGETYRAENRIGGRIVETHVSPALVDGRPSGLCVMVSQDVTARREVEDNLAVASRLAAMGTLVGGIAHEINNPLAGSMAGTDWAARTLREMRHGLERAASADPGALAARLGEVLDALDDAMAGSRRIAAIVKDLATAGGPSPERTLVRVRDVVAEGVLRMPAPLRERVMVRVVDQGAPDVLAAPGQLAQAISNLLDNAAASMPAGHDDDIVVSIGRNEAGGARLEVEDRGAGIPPELMGRIFDPFFTTREIGKGVGLGLAVAHAIVTAHGGTITASSALGVGSTFRIELPASS
jgi:PAS domain S-box-containing protein